MTFESIESLVEYQAEHQLGDVHLVFVNNNHYLMAHTDMERDLAHRFPAAMPLTDCEYDGNMRSEDEAPVPEGLYVMVEHKPGRKESHKLWLHDLIPFAHYDA